MLVAVYEVWKFPLASLPLKRWWEPAVLEGTIESRFYRLTGICLGFVIPVLLNFRSLWIIAAARLASVHQKAPSLSQYFFG